MPTSLLRAGPLAADFVSGTNRPNFGVRNGHRVAEFPAAGTTETFYTFNMPTVFAQGDIEVILTWMGKVAVGGDCVWEVAFERNQPGVDDLDSDSFAAGIAAVDAANATPGIPTETRIDVTAAQYDGIVQGDQFRLAVRRLGDDSSDIMSGDAQLMTITIEQTADPAGGGGGGFWSDGAGTRAGIGQGSPVPVASGLEALAHGSGATAVGDHSLALMAYADAASDYTLSLGYQSDADGARSIAIGYSAKGGDLAPLEEDCIGIGTHSSARGNRSIAIGYHADTSNYDYYALAIGVYAAARKHHAIAIGPYTDADGYYNIAIGADVYSNISHENIGIGHEIYSRGNHNIFIGHKCGTPEDASADVNNIGIGYKVYGHEGDCIAIGQELNVGDGDIILGFEHLIGSNQDPTYTNGNICIKTDHDTYAGLDNSGSGSSGFHWANIVLVAGSRAGLRSWDGNNQQRNVLISAGGGSYIYGTCDYNILIGNGSEIGDQNNQTDAWENNIIIGNDNFIGWYSGKDTEYNVVIGAECNIGTGAKRGNVLIGKSLGLYTENANYYTYGNVILGYSSRINNAFGSCSIGYGNYIYAYGPMTGAYWDYFRGNVALGVGCRIEAPSFDKFNSTLAHGCGAKPWLGGHRAFSDDFSTQSQSNPNQGGFIVPKIETDDNVQTTLATFPTQADKAYLVYGHLIARRTDVDGKNAAFSIGTQLVYRNAAGVPTLVGDPVSFTMDKNQGSPTWVADASISGNNLLVRVTGVTGETVEWLGVIWVLEVRG